MKLTVKYVSRSDCYVSLPQKYLSSYPIEFDYKQNKICDVVECRLPNGKKNYFGFHGSTSQNESSLEISEAFAVALGIPENEYVDVKPFQGATLAKSIDIYCRNPVDYQLVAQNRASIESKLLNQIAVVFPGICFPISYSQNDQVILTYKDQNVLLLGENIDLNILCEAIVADSTITTSLKIIPSLTVRIQSLENHANRPIDLQNYLYINWAVGQKFQIKENEPYLLELQFPKLVRLASNFQKFCNRFRQIQYQMHDAENINFNAPKQFPVLIRFKDNLPNDFLLDTTLGHPNIFAPKLMIQSLKMTESQIAKITPLEDFKNNRVMFLDETIKLSKYKILVRLLANPFNSQSKVLGDCKKQLIAAIMDEQQKDAVLYDKQLIFLSDSLMRLRIFEKSPDGLLKDIKLLHFKLNPEKLKAKKAEIEKVLNEVITTDLGDNNKLDEIRPGRSKEILEIYDEKLKAASKKNANFIYKGFHQKELTELRCALKEGTSQILMLKGLVGSGKSTIVERLFQSDETHFFSKARVHFKELLSPKNPEESASVVLIRKYLRLNFELAILNQPSILVLEDVDVICKHKDRIDAMNPEEGILAETTSALLKDLMKEVLALEHNVCVYVLITTRGGDFLSEEFGKVKKKEIAVEKISTESKVGFLSSELEQFGTHIKDEQLKMLEMFNLQNLVVLREKLSRELELYPKEEVTPKKADAIFQSHLDALCNSMSTVSSIQTTFKEVGGLSEVKQAILDTFQAPLKYNLIFKNVNIKLPRGILLFGPSGCGKTLIAAAAANELGLNFLSVKGPELLNKYIGASEQAVRDIFEKASARSPCIIFFDEFDSIVPKRNSGSTGVTDRVVNQFLCYLDGASEIKDIFILAATSRPDLIDPALLRPGRIDKHVFLDYPNEKERLEILQIYMQGTASDGLDLAEYAAKTEGYSGADLSALVKNAQIKALHVILETENKENLKKGDLNLVITREIFEKCLQEFKKSSKRDSEQRKMMKVYEDFIGKKNLDISKQKTTLY